MSDKELYIFLRDINCCKLCCLRYIGLRTVEYYANIDEAVVKLGFETALIEQPVKRLKENTCSACLGLLQSQHIDNLVDEVSKCDKIKLYDSNNLTCAVSLPISLQLRALAVWLGLLEKFPTRINKNTAPDIPLKEAWKWIISPKLSTALCAQLAPNGSIITIYFEYEADELELDTLRKLKPSAFKQRWEKKYHGEILTRNFFEVSFNPCTIKFNDFTEHCQYPPSIPESELKVKNIDVLGDTLFLAGRYMKFSRELSQSPWILNGNRLMEGSVQEIISEPVLKLFMSDPNLLRFSSSGREDVDVRCLGRGRPFVLELPDCKVTNISYDMFRQLEKDINISEQVKVRDLQIVKREELHHIKHGEETKKKQYKALCVCTGDVKLTENIISILNLPNGFTIQQKTPIRVLHRRTLIVRPREVFNMGATLVENHPNMFYLDVQTQAGTYIKELVHGDLGRTLPNIKQMLTKEIFKEGDIEDRKSFDAESILNFNVDIIALDVTEVDLDWPPILC